MPLVANLKKAVPLGLHKYTWLESNDTGSTVSWYGNRSNSGGDVQIQSGMSGVIEC